MWEEVLKEGEMGTHRGKIIDVDLLKCSGVDQILVIKHSYLLKRIANVNNQFSHVMLLKQQNYAKIIT